MERKKRHKYQKYSQNIPKIFPKYPKNIPKIFPKYPKNIPKISPRYPVISSKNVDEIRQQEGGGMAGHMYICFD